MSKQYISTTCHCLCDRRHGNEIHTARNINYNAQWESFQLFASFTENILFQLLLSGPISISKQLLVHLLINTGSRPIESVREREMLNLCKCMTLNKSVDFSLERLLCGVTKTHLLIKSKTCTCFYIYGILT